MRILRRRGITYLELLVVVAIGIVSVLLARGIINLLLDYAPPRGRPVTPAYSPSSVGTPNARDVRDPSKAGGSGWGPSKAGGSGWGPSKAGGSGFKPRTKVDTSGFGPVVSSMPPWEPDASLEKIAEHWKQPGIRVLAPLEEQLNQVRNEPDLSLTINLLILKAMLLDSEREPGRAYKTLEEARSLIETDSHAAREWLYTIVYFQGVTALRRGENENCIECRGESSCILPIAPAAIHTIPAGSRLAIRHFTEYLNSFPDDLEVRWLLNLAHMTLGEHPDKVDSRFLISLDRYRNSEFDIGHFRDVGHLVGVNRFNQAGGAVMEDFDNDGLLDLAVTSFDPTEPLSVYRNKGNGVFEDRSEAAGVTKQLGGLYCVQTDYNNDGFMDVYIPRGAWLPIAMRPSLLRNNGIGTFTDVTQQAGLLDPVNSNSAGWADYDNDGWLDLFVCCERQPNRLYHNRKDGTFEEVASWAGLYSKGPPYRFCKGQAWIDFDNDDYPDLFVNNLNGYADLYRNNRNGTFSEVTMTMGVDGPMDGFSCWAWDYDNDGWLDLFANCYDRTMAEVVKGLLGQPHSLKPNKLFRNRGGNSFEDKTKEAGLDMVFAAMGSNYGDFDNDGFLDFYLGTGEPSFATLVPNRMFKNVGGQRFAEISGTSGTGHLQKGHGVACGDWDRDGDVDIFIQTGGAVNGDKYHNILFQNPGQGNHWLTVKLVGKKTNRAAIGARIKVVTAGENPLTVHRHVSSGSSFGANPLQQTIGLAKAKRVALLEIHWPTSGTTQVFRDIAADQAIEVTEFAESFRPMDWKPIPQPE
jgi:ASPIC and UnbV/FG-GAP-like repeat